MKRFLLFVGLVFAFSQIGWGLTLAEIRTQVRRNVRDTATDADFQRYSDAILTDTVNTAQREVVNAVPVLITDDSFTSSTGVMFYDQSSNFIAPLKVAYLKTGSTTRNELVEKTLEGLYAKNSNWEDQTGTPINYYVRQKPGGTVKQIGLYPAPVATSTGTVYVTETIFPDDLSSDGDIPFNGALWLVTYHKVLVDYVTGILKQIEGKNDEASGYYSLAASGINQMRMRLGELPNYTPGMSVSGPNR